MKSSHTTKATVTVIVTVTFQSEKFKAKMAVKEMRGTSMLTESIVRRSAGS